MEAVIFNGNEKLSPLGMAEVSLTFDNDAQRLPATDLDLEISTLPAHIRDLAEITVTRRYFRSGESEYFINRTPCRLKDITELFLGTGVGSKAYAIIEQGRVEQLINAKPEDRRLFIEEAAGTTLYRSRKLAAERKMERTRENLSRVNDILREIERQTQYLDRQAKKAELYKRLVAELRELELRVVGRQWRGLQWELAEIDAQRAALVAEVERLRGALLESHARARAGRRRAQRGRAAAMRARREQLAVLEAERESVRQRIALLRSSSATNARAGWRGWPTTAEATRAAAAQAAERGTAGRARARRVGAAPALRRGRAAHARRTISRQRASRSAPRQAALEAAKGVADRARDARGRKRATRRRPWSGVATRSPASSTSCAARKPTLEQRRAEIDAQLVVRRADLERCAASWRRRAARRRRAPASCARLAEAHRRWRAPRARVRGGAAADALAPRVARADPVATTRAFTAACAPSCAPSSMPTACSAWSPT